MYRLLSLRFVLPALIGLLMLIGILFSFLITRDLIFDEIVEQETVHLHDRLNFLQGVMQHYLRFDEVESVRQVVSSLASESDLAYLMIVDKNGKVIAASDFIDHGKDWQLGSHKINAAMVEKVIAGESASIHHDVAASMINGYSSLCIHSGSNGLRSKDCGFIYYQIDLEYHFKLSEASIYRGYQFAGSLLLIGVLLFLLLIDRLITRRVNLLVNALKHYSSDDRSVRPELKGHDELNWLSKSIARLLDDIELANADIIERENKLETLFQTVLDAIVIISDKGILLRVNAAAEKMFGYTENELVGRNVSILMPEPHRSEHDQYLRNYKKTGVKKVIGISREVTAVNRSGKSFPVEISVTEMLVNDQKTYSGIIRDITERKDLELAMKSINDELILSNKRLNEYATKDSLTNIFNRRSFDIRINEELNRVTRDKLPLSLLMCDVDYFKLYNDTYGHQQGDDCLYKVATIIKTFFQRGGEMVARYGGEEFVVILPNADAEQATWLAGMLIKAVHELDEPHSASRVSNRITISIGVGTYEPSGKIPPSADKLIRSADEGLYKAKANGRDRVEFGVLID
ncbi:MAG: diguanylate cyclase [Gammaproteobacteria bacterium]|nr:diguanylate cyclase [Gammaproteobacteria bacterium]